MATLDKIRLSGTTYDIIDATAIHSLDGYYTTGETNAAITAATNALAESIAEQGYQTSGDVQNAISGKVDTSALTAVNDTLTAHTANTDIHVTSSDKEAWNAKADISDIPSVSGYADAVAYDSGTTTMNFYHGGTGGTVVYSFDASPFIIDGMIDDVRIETVSGATYLVIDFNTASGKEDIYIPLSDIFDPSNYYTKSEIDASLSGKADVSAVTVSSTDEGTVTDSENTRAYSFAATTSDGVYYFSGYAQSLFSIYLEDLRIDISDGTNSSHIDEYTADGAETSAYTYSKTNDGFIVETKGLNRITYVFINCDDLVTLEYQYKYAKSVDIAASTAIEDVIYPKLNQIESGKTDVSAFTAHTADTTIHVTSEDKTTWSGKQDALVSGTNIKTINGNSLLGSGDLTVDTGLHAEVSGTTLVFS